MADFSPAVCRVEYSFSGWFPLSLFHGYFASRSSVPLKSSLSRSLLISLIDVRGLCPDLRGICKMRNVVAFVAGLVALVTWRFGPGSAAG